MGRAVTAAAEGDRRFVLAARVGRGTTPAELTASLASADVLVDFSLPAPALAFARAAAR
ncbi:MAG: hypothetical protein FD126_2387, partial [Elusimicrobia bacterium]